MKRPLPSSPLRKNTISTFGMAAVFGAALLCCWTVFHFLSIPDRHQLLGDVSTNVHNLGHHPLFVMLASAFWAVDGPVAYWMIAMVIGVAGCQRFFGWRTTLLIAFGAHVVATLITEGGVWWMVSAGWQSRRHLYGIDVGPSYIVVATLTAVIVRGSGAWRWAATFALAPIAGSVLVTIPHLGIAETGHVISFALVAVVLLVANLRRVNLA